jgi:hypothetical protein
MSNLTLNSEVDMSTIDEIALNIDTICEVTGCHMEWSEPTQTTVSWAFSFKNENQEECARSMLMDLIYDFPYLLTMN